MNRRESFKVSAAMLAGLAIPIVPERTFTFSIDGRQQWAPDFVATFNDKRFRGTLMECVKFIEREQKEVTP